MGSLGMPEILMILVIALIIFGPRKLPELGKTLGNSLAQFRRASEDFKRQWEDEVDLERRRIEPPQPAPVEHELYSGEASAGSEQSTSSLEEVPASAPTVSEAPLASHQEETVVKETKRDWM
jgi:sec-independent protein translocase protein TatA